MCQDVMLTADTRVEEEETFSIRLTAPDDAPFVLPHGTTATVTILDTDSKKNFTENLYSLKRTELQKTTQLLALPIVPLTTHPLTYIAM